MYVHVCILSLRVQCIAYSGLQSKHKQNTVLRHHTLAIIITLQFTVTGKWTHKTLILKLPITANFINTNLTLRTNRSTMFSPG